MPEIQPLQPQPAQLAQVTSTSCATPGRTPTISNTQGSATANPTFAECLQSDDSSSCLNSIKELIQNIAALLTRPATGSSATPPVAQTPNTAPTTGTLADTIHATLTPDPNGNVHEEELQHAIVTHLLAQTSAGAKDAYTQAYATARAQGMPAEDSVKAALSATVQAQKISTTDAEKINGISFRAAQLDTDLTALFDNRGGKNDPTVAVAPFDTAIQSATAVLEDIRSGKTAAQPRALTAPSNTVANAVAARGGSQAGGASTQEGFLWKPVSDSNGKLAVLLPPSLAGDVSSLSIYSAAPESGGILLEEGRFSGNANGGRDHYRFSKPGSSYPDGAFVVAQLSAGGTAVFQIGDSSQRNG